MASSAFIVEDFVSVPKNTLVGFAKVLLPSGLIFLDIAVHQRGADAWASLPTKAMVGRDGLVMRDAAGKVRYDAIVEFASAELRARFSASVVEALRVAFPAALS